jgi:hypothetical protein
MSILDGRRLICCFAAAPDALSRCVFNAYSGMASLGRTALANRELWTATVQTADRKRKESTNAYSLGPCGFAGPCDDHQLH